LASSTKKREGKVRSSSSLGLILDLIISFVIIFTIIIGVAVPSPRFFHSGRRKRWVDCGLGGLKTHRSAHFTLTLLQVRKPLTHLLMTLTDKGIVGSAHGYESLEALDKNVLFLPPMSSSFGGLWSS
jgi:thiosulfate reductase cytochrome b subunit